MSRKISEDEKKELIKFLKDIIRIPSSQQDGREIYDFLYEYLEKNGLEPEFQKIDNPHITYHTYSNLYVKLGNGNGPKIMINGHLDTVSAKGNWYYKPYSAEEEEGRIYGLGAADMKGGMAAAVHSIIALTKRRKEINGELFLSCVFGEEAPFSLGADTLLREHDISDYDLIIVTEPSPLLAINDYCIVHKQLHKKPRFPVPIVGAEGRVAFEITFQGRSSHASHPSMGINALHDAARVITQLVEFDLFSNIKMGRGHYVILNIEGGDQTFTVPAQCKILVNRQLTLGEDAGTVLMEIKQIIKTLRLDSKVRVAKRYSPAPELEYKPYLFEEDKNIDKFVNMLEPTEKDGKRCKFTTSSVGDNNIFASRTGVPTLVFGPGGGNIHSPNEYVYKEDVIETTDHLLTYLMEMF